MSVKNALGVKEFYKFLRDKLILSKDRLSLNYPFDKNGSVI